MQRLQGRSFFELTWSIFRLCMKSIFAVLSVIYLFGTVVLFFLSPDLGTLPAHQFLASLGSALLFGLVFMTYFTLLLAVPVTAFCASLAFLVTGLVRIYEFAFPHPKSQMFSWPDFMEEPPSPEARVEFIEVKNDAQSAICPVCAAGIQTAHVNCQRCDAPHHVECWEYIGSCATFGCGCDKSMKDGEPVLPPKSEWWDIRGMLQGKGKSN